MQPVDKQAATMGLFEFSQIPFGKCNAPRTFSRLLKSCAADQNSETLVLYLDAKIVFSSGFMRHMCHIYI